MQQIGTKYTLTLRAAQINHQKSEKMKAKKFFKALIIFWATALTVWVGMFATDFYRSGHLMPPVFARPVAIITKHDTGHNIYKGIGYTVETDTCIGQNFDTRLISVTMYVGGKAVSASIT